MQGDGSGGEEEKEIPIASVSTLSDALKQQVSYLRLDERKKAIVLRGH